MKLVIMKFFSFLLAVPILMWHAGNAAADNPCAARPIANKSVVCVCNATYCDDVTRDAPSAGQYVAYTSSEAGLRFQKSSGDLQSDDQTDLNGAIVLELDPTTKFQNIEGFGGAVTDAAGIHWTSLPEAQRKFFIDSYCGANGLEYNMLRVPIGGCDFSTHEYAYNELPIEDSMLDNFALAYEDYNYKIPMIKACMEVATSPVEILGTTWAPPKWMMTDSLFGRNQIRPEFYQAYALYHTKFIEKYGEEDVPIWGITTTNEPSNANMGISGTDIPFNTVGWTASTMGQWIVNNLGPTIRNSSYKDVKILGVDDQRYAIPYWLDMILADLPEAANYLDGVAVHWYFDKQNSPDQLTRVTNRHPDMFVLSTEACSGFLPEDEKVDLGSWSRAKDYVLDIIEDLNYNVVGWIDWNMCLDQQGGPNWVDNFVDSAVIVYPEEGEFVKQPMFYAMGHFAKFLPRGSTRINVTASDTSVENVAVVTPRDTIVTVLYNDANSTTTVSVKVGAANAVLQLEANSITTLEFSLPEL